MTRGGTGAHSDFWELLCRRYQDAVVHDIEDRMAHWTHLPADHGEDLQVSWTCWCTRSHRMHCCCIYSCLKALHDWRGAGAEVPAGPKV